MTGPTEKSEYWVEIMLQIERFRTLILLAAVKPALPQKRKHAGWEKTIEDEADRSDIGKVDRDPRYYSSIHKSPATDTKEKRIRLKEYREKETAIKWKEKKKRSVSLTALPASGFTSELGTITKGPIYVSADDEHPVKGKSPKRLSLRPISSPAPSTSTLDDSNVNEKTVLSTVPKTENILNSRICSKGEVAENIRRLDGTDEHKHKGIEELLDKETLDKCCSAEGRTSSNLLKECEKICSFIKRTSKDIVHVCPAYKIGEETAVTFVAFASKTVSLSDLPWLIRVRILGQKNDNDKRLLFSEKIEPLSTEKAREVSSVIDKYSKDLMKKHKFLSGISASSIMYERNEAGEKITVSRPCIVLYALVEECMPLLEDKYPKTLEGIPVDVREGEFRFCGVEADQFHEKVCMGCKIETDIKCATLGGFIEHMEYGLCGITCAHVFLNATQQQNLKRFKVLNVDNLEDIFGNSEPRYIFQPSKEDNNNSIGRLVHLVYKEGDNLVPGVDLAVFTIENRFPSTGSFPNENGHPSDLKFNSGKVLGKLGILAHKPRVQKFGQETKSTVGTLLFSNSVARAFDFNTKLLDNKEKEDYLTSTLFKQYHVEPNSGDFCKNGDSGALVFIEDGQQNLRCIGMLVGFQEKFAVVTPIAEILKELGVSSLVSFKPEVRLDFTEDRFATKTDLKEMEDRLMNAINGTRKSDKK